MTTKDSNALGKQRWQNFVQELDSISLVEIFTADFITTDIGVTCGSGPEGGYRWPSDCYRDKHELDRRVGLRVLHL